MWRVFSALVLAVTLYVPASAACRTDDVVAGTVAAGGTSLVFQLEGAAQSYVLAGLFLEAPLAMPQGAVKLHVLGKPDRYERIPVMAFRADESLQAEWLREGRAMIYGQDLPGPCLATLRAAEDEARREGRGIWGKRAVHDVAKTADLLKRAGHFELVSGTIASVGDRKRRLYLNFGRNWRQDTTVSVAKTGAGRFNGDVDELAAAQGRRVEIRGLVESSGGPLIRLFDVSQIRFLDDADR